MLQLVIQGLDHYLNFLKTIWCLLWVCICFYQLPDEASLMTAGLGTNLRIADYH